MVKIGIIGLGDMGRAHCLGFDNVAGAEITAICDPSEWGINNGREVIKNNKPQVFRDYREMLAQAELDAVVIAVPNYLHKEVALAALAAGKHVFLEKPIATNIRDCDTIIAAAQAAGKVLQIGLVYRYSNLYRRMGRECDGRRRGLVGMVWCKEFRECFPQLPWFYDEKLSGGTLVEKNCHHFDIFNWLIGARPRRVFASGGQHVYKRGERVKVACSYCPHPPAEMEDISIIDHAWVLIDYENGAKANLGLCMYLKPRNLMDEGLEIGALFTDGTQMIAKRDRELQIVGGENADRTRIEIDCESDTRGQGHIGAYRQREEFIDCIVNGKEPYANWRVGREALLIALAAEKSIKEERAVEIREIEAEGLLPGDSC